MIHDLRHLPEENDRQSERREGGEGKTFYPTISMCHVLKTVQTFFQAEIPRTPL